MPRRATKMTTRTAFSRRPTAPVPEPKIDRASALWREALILFVLAAAVLLVFWPACNGAFLTWDDVQNIARNPRLNPPSLEGILHFWREPYLSMYIPLTYSVWGVLAGIAQNARPDAAGIRLDPSLFHTVNLLLHIGSAWIVYRLLRRLVTKPWAAMGGALLFAIHPIQVEPVAWITGTKDVLSGFLALLALWQYVLVARASSPCPGAREQGIVSSSSQADGHGQDAHASRRTTFHYAVATIAFVLAMLAKPSAVTVPLAALVLDRWLVRRPWKQILLALSPWFLLAIPCVLAARWAQPVVRAAGETDPLWARPLLAAHALAFYLYKLVLPIWLMPQYDQSPKAILAHGWLYWTWIVPVAIAIVVWLYRKRLPWAVAAAGLVIAGVLPVLGLVPFSFETLSLVADRYLYIAMLGPALVVAFALTLIPAAKRKLSVWVCAGLLLVMGGQSFRQTLYWHDTETLMLHELAVNPQSTVAFTALANTYQLNGQPQRAFEYARKQIQRDPGDAGGYFSAGDILTAIGQVDQAMAYYQRGLKLQPDNIDAQANYAGLLAQKGRLGDAITISRRILSLVPEYEQAHLNLAVMLAQENKIDEAIAEFEAAVRCDPNDPKAHTYLATLLAEKGRSQEAMNHYLTALQLNPEFVDAKEGVARLRGQGMR